MIIANENFLNIKEDIMLTNEKLFDKWHQINIRKGRA